MSAVPTGTDGTAGLGVEELVRSLFCLKTHLLLSTHSSQTRLSNDRNIFKRFKATVDTVFTYGQYSIKQEFSKTF